MTRQARRCEEDKTGGENMGLAQDRHKEIWGGDGWRWVEGLRRALVAGACSSWNTTNISLILICLFRQSICFSYFLCYRHDPNQPQLTQPWNNYFCYCTYLPCLICVQNFVSNAVHNTIYLFFPLLLNLPPGQSLNAESGSAAVERSILCEMFSSSKAVVEHLVGWPEAVPPILVLLLPVF